MKRIELKRRLIRAGEFLLLLLCASGTTTAGSLEPKLNRFESCVSPIALTGKELAARSKSGVLYYQPLHSRMAESTDYQLMQPFRLSGFLLEIGILPDAYMIPEDNQLTMTGSVYERTPGAGESLIGRSSKKYFLEIENNSQLFLLKTESLIEVPIFLCSELSGS
jgi:hypothetical protein